MKKLAVTTIASLFVLAAFAEGAFAQAGGSGTTGTGQTPAGSTPSPGTSGAQKQPEKAMEKPGAERGAGGQAADAETIKQAQEQLKSAGFDPGPTDGIMGPQTQKALKDYQQSKGLKASGQLDQETRQALLSAGAGGTMTTPSATTPGTGTTPSAPGTTPPGQKSDSGTTPGGTSPGASSGGSTGGTGKAQ